MSIIGYRWVLGRINVYFVGKRITLKHTCILVSVIKRKYTHARVSCRHAKIRIICVEMHFCTKPVHPSLETA